MSIQVFQTEKEHIQTALDLVARMIFEKASEILSGGNSVTESCKALLTLSNTALSAGYSNTVINVYYSILDEENSKNYLGDCDD